MSSGASTGRTRPASVFAADVTADSVIGRFVLLSVTGPRAGGSGSCAAQDLRDRRTDQLATHKHGLHGSDRGERHIDGWYLQPSLVGPRAYGAGVARDNRVIAVGGVADSVPLAVSGNWDPAAGDGRYGGSKPAVGILHRRWGRTGPAA